MTLRNQAMPALHPTLLVILLYISLTHALSLSRCSSTNLGGEKTSSEFMSNGLCRDTCSKDGYAVAVLSGNDCYCTNDVPADTTDMSNCEIGCPGYKDQENCAGDGYFGYLIIGQPSATVGGETSTSKSTQSSTSTSTSTSSTSTSSSTSSSTSTSSTSSSPSTSTSTTSESPSSTSPATTMVTKTTQITETHRSSNIVQVTQYSTEVLTVSPSTTSKSSTSSSSKSSSQTPIVSTKIEQTTAYSIKTVNGTQTQEIKTLYITQFTTQSTLDSTTGTTSFESASISNLRSQDASVAPTLSVPSSSTTDSPKTNKNAFFDDKGKVAGTFTAVGIVVVGIVGAMLYCCCCFGGAGGRHNDHDGYSDEENQYSSDELSVNHATVVAPYSKQSSFSTLKRDSSSKTLFAYFTGDNTNKESGVNRSSSRRKLMSRRSSQMSSSPNNNPEADGGAMFPINEIDSRLDPDTMFLNQNFSNKSLGDNQDYSRKLKITNPE